MTHHEKLKALLSKAGLTKPGGSIDYQKVCLWPVYTVSTRI